MVFEPPIIKVLQKNNDDIRTAANVLRGYGTFG